MRPNNWKANVRKKRSENYIRVLNEKENRTSTRAITKMIEEEGMYESIWVSILRAEQESRHKQAKEESFITLGGHFRW